MEQEQEAFFDLGDNTALVCVDHQQYQKIVVPQLIDLTYKVHLGLFEEDVSLKLKVEVSSHTGDQSIGTTRVHSGVRHFHDGDGEEQDAQADQNHEDGDIAPFLPAAEFRCLGIGHAWRISHVTRPVRRNGRWRGRRTKRTDTRWRT